jgi:DNA-directed RNA polymerase specialized sigma24 family protein
VKRDHGPPAEGATSFDTTRWTIVVRAAQSQAPAGESALAELRLTYWHPLYMFTRHRGHSSDDAQDLTQGFFLHLLEQRALAGVLLDPVNGRAPPSYEEVARRLGISTGAVKTLIHRLRNRYTATLREEVGRIIASEGRLAP